MDLFNLKAVLGLDSSEYEKGISNALSVASSFGSGLASAAAIGTAAITAVGTAAVGAGVALVNATADVASYGDSIDKMSQKMGISAEAYQEWEAVMQHSGTSMESLKAGMKTLANAVESGSDAFERLGITQKEIESMNQEELFSATITALQGVENETERTYLAGQLLGRGATELGALLNTSAEETQAMKDRVHELGGVMSDEAVKAAAAYQDQLQDMTTAFEGLKRGIMSDFMPSITTVMSGLTEIFAGNYGEGLEFISDGIDQVVGNITDKLPDVLEIATGIFGALASAIGDNASTIIGTLTDVVINIVEQIANGAPDIVNIALDIINTLIDSISSSLPDLIPALSDGITEALKALTDSKTITQLGASAASLVQGLVTGITKALPSLVKTAPVIVGNLVKGIVGAVGELAKTAGPIMDAIKSIFTEENMQGILEAIEEMIVTIGDSLINYADIILDAVSGLLDELTESDEASEGLANLVSSMIDQLFGFLEEYLPKFEEKLAPIAEQLWPKVVELAGKMFEKFTEIVGVIAPFIPQIVNGLVGVLLESGTLQIIIKGWIDVFTSVVKALPDIIKPLLTAAPSIIVDLTEALIECIPDLIECAIEINAAIVEALPEIISALIDAVPGIITAIIDAFKENRIIEEFIGVFEEVWDGVTKAFEGFVGDAVFWGADLVENFVDGVKGKLGDIEDAVGENGVTGTVRKFMHFSKPDVGPLADFDTYAPDMMDLFAKGVRDNTPTVTNAIQNAFDFGGMITGGMPTGGAQMPGLITPTASQPIQVTLVLDKQQLGKVVFDLNNQERQRVGVTLGKEIFA